MKVLAILCTLAIAEAQRPTWAYAYAQEVRKSLGERYCYHEEHWRTLDADIKAGRNVIEIRVCHIENRHGKLFYKYRVVATTPARIVDAYGDRLTWGEDVRSQITFKEEE